LLVSSLGDSAAHASSVLVSSDDTSSHVSADLSELGAELVLGALVGSLSVGSHLL